MAESPGRTASLTVKISLHTHILVQNSHLSKHNHTAWFTAWHDIQYFGCLLMQQLLHICDKQIDKDWEQPPRFDQRQELKSMTWKHLSSSTPYEKNP